MAPVGGGAKGLMEPPEGLLAKLMCRRGSRSTEGGQQGLLAKLMHRRGSEKR